MERSEPILTQPSSTLVGVRPADAVFAFVLERDVDFLLVQELSCSADFRRMFAERAFPGLDIASAEWRVRHSVARSGAVPGETDIELTFAGDPLPGLARLLIENKVDAPFQPEQAFRYGQDAIAARDSGLCWATRTCLVAPEEYLSSHSGTDGFDLKFSYQELARHLEDRASAAGGELADRLRYQALILEAAITKSRRGYVPIPSTEVTDFWVRYWESSVEVAPSLRMEKPAVRGGRSSWIRFPQALVLLPSEPRAFLVHKLEKGRVQLEFPGWAGRMQVLEQLVRQSESDFEAWPAGKSAAIAIRVPTIDPAGDFEGQVDAVRSGLDAALRLQRWWGDHRQSLRDQVVEDPR